MNYKNWYSNHSVQFQIIQFTKNKEVALISKRNNPTAQRRHLRVHNAQAVVYIINTYGISRGFTPNLYTTVATYKNGFPPTRHETFNDIKKEWIQNHQKKITSYPLFIDIDGDNHKEFYHVKLSMQLLHNHLVKKNVPHEIRFSGMGYHFIIPNDDLDISFDQTKPNNVYKINKDIATQLNDEISELIDLKIYDSRRLIKCPYSLAIYGNNYYVCLPLKSEADLKLNPEDFKPEKWYNEIFQRGTHVFNPEGTIQNLIKK